MSEYANQVSWTEGKQGRLSAEGLPDLEVATPPEFGGPAGFWSPEQLFIAAANSCVMATFLAIASNSKLPFKGYTGVATGKVEKLEGGLQISEITIRVVLKLEQEKDRDRAQRVLVKAEENCLVSRSMKTKVKVDPEISAA